MDLKLCTRVHALPVLLALIIIMALSPACSKNAPAPPAAPAELAKATRVDTNGWINVHLEGTPREIGFQHGWLLAAEIDDFLKALGHFLEGSTKRDWAFFRASAERMFWPKLEPEYQEEIEGIAAGLRARLPRSDLRPHRHHGPQRLDRARLVLRPLSRRDGQARAPATTRPRATAAPSSPRGAGPRAAASSSATTTGSTTSSARAGTSSPTSSRRRASAS